MAEAGVAPPVRNDAPRLRRHWRVGLTQLHRFLRQDGGLDSAFEGMFALAGPTVQSEFDRFASSEVGERLLAEHPRRDLNAFLADRETLGAMPTGSLAAEYLAYMGGEGMGSSDDFLSAAGLDEKAASFGWTEDQLWFVRRMANSHDLFHVVSGYGRDIIGEIGVNAFTAGQIPLLPVRLLLAYQYLLKPSRPFEWVGFVSRANRHGKRVPSLACVDFEAMFPLPLEEARQRMGIPAMAEIHPRGFPEPARTLLRIEAGFNNK